uniref:solute carrier organic anion transporter family member 3A1-like isoform X1 n=1 Tax=Myxine glutinosa TaxID=7769 RepID=UPI00358DF74F
MADSASGRARCVCGPRLFVAAQGALLMAQTTSNAYLVSMLTTIERRFSLSSTQLGLISSSFELGNLLPILFVSYFGARGHRPRLIGCGGIIMALGTLLSALPEFLSHQYQPQTKQSLRFSEISQQDVCQHNETGLPWWDTTPASSAQECHDGNPKDAQTRLYLVLVGAQILVGIGATPVQPLGFAYIDDHVTKKESPFYFGILFTIMLLGPTVGFMLGSLFTRIYVDALFIDTSQLDLTLDDPRWIGAWWAGFLLCAALLFLFSMFMFGFPRSLPTTPPSPSPLPPPMQNYYSMPEAEPHGSAGPLPISGPASTGTISETDMAPPQMLRNGSVTLTTETESTETPSVCGQLRAIPGETLAILRNPVFTCVLLSGCAEVAAVASFSSFLSKYLESQFDLTATFANQILGLAVVPCACLGIFLGGGLMRWFSLSSLSASRFTIIASILSISIMTPLITLGCGTGSVAGLNSHYPTVYNLSYGEWPIGEQAPCNMKCGCQSSASKLLCGADGLTYLSPCYAGCIHLNLSMCLCVDDGAGELGASAVSGKCSNPECQSFFPPFIGLLCFSVIFGFSIQTPSFMLNIRSVKAELKSYALGLIFLLYRLLGFIPGPLIYGWAIDLTCLVWSERCGPSGGNNHGACALYDCAIFRNIFVGLTLGLKLLALGLYVAVQAFILARPGRYFVEKKPDESTWIRRRGSKFVYNVGDQELCENVETVL